LKHHAKHIAAGGIVAPTAFGLAAAIANEVQTLIGLNLHGTGLALYIAAFCLGAAAVLHGQLRLEAQKLIAELGSGELDLGALLGGLGGMLGGAGQEGPPGAGPLPPPKSPTGPPPPPPAQPLPPPPPPPAAPGEPT
jgi:hypothetical protein